MKTVNVRAIFVVVLALAILTPFCLPSNASYANPSSTCFTIVNTRGEHSQEAFTSIQQAIDEAQNGSTIMVPSGFYREHVVVNKTVSLIGAGFSTTTIDGYNNGTVVKIVANDVIISGFTIKNSSCTDWKACGVHVYYANSCEIRDCYFSANCHNVHLQYSYNSRVLNNTINTHCYGIRFTSSVNCTAIGNYASNCYGGIILNTTTNCIVTGNTVSENGYGIRLDSPCVGNRIFENFVSNNAFAGVIDVMNGNSTFLDNIIFHNNFFNNNDPFVIQTVSGIIWDNGFEGNFWSHYNGSDTTHDGIGDTSYIMENNNIDHFPLMGTFSNFSVHYGGQYYYVSVVSNSTILSFAFDEANNTIRLSVNGTEGTYGFCRISIPHALMMPEIKVIIDDNATEVLYANYTLRDDGFSRWIYFAYQHSAHEILITSEFWPVTYLLSLIIATLFYLLFMRINRKRTGES